MKRRRGRTRGRSDTWSLAMAQSECPRGDVGVDRLTRASLQRGIVRYRVVHRHGVA
jgi:hypothetical protein